MRPIVSFCGSPTYQLSKYLTNVLKPLTDESRHKLQSTENFIDAIKTIQIPDDHKLVSFDVKLLFTTIPLQLALDCTENANKNSTVELPLTNTQTNSGPVTTATISYIKGSSETIARILQPCNIPVAHKPITT